MAALADPLLEALVDAFGNQELGIFGPAVIALGAADFFFSQRFAVGFFRVLLLWRSEANVAVDDDQRRPIGRIRRRIERLLEHFQVVGIGDVHDVPAIAPRNAWPRPR